MILGTSFIIDLMDADESVLARKQKIEENKENYRVAVLRSLSYGLEFFRPACLIRKNQGICSIVRD